MKGIDFHFLNQKSSESTAATKTINGGKKNKYDFPLFIFQSKYNTNFSIS